MLSGISKGGFEPWIRLVQCIGLLCIAGAVASLLGCVPNIEGTTELVVEGLEHLVMLAFVGNWSGFLSRSI